MSHKKIVDFKLTGMKFPKEKQFCTAMVLVSASGHTTDHSISKWNFLKSYFILLSTWIYQ